MGIIQSIFRMFGFKPIKPIKDKPFRHVRRKRHKVNIGYIVHTSESSDCNGKPIKTFKSKRNSLGYAKKLSRRLDKTVYVYQVDLNHYSLGTGDTVEINRYGVFNTYVFRV
ncbi:hypothetical protein [Methanolobus sp.]|jgi:hypothetical protein|uniref:hypothetical protein n=1 Tax=Methanolobus sp. TaxID=1874737 RepID=UPI0025D307F1|nr:hypothetical protein [Methanolobus sp.]